MDVTVLGCAGGYPSPASAASGYLVRSGPIALWVDCGSGTFAELQRHIAPHLLTGVVLTHRHADHCVDLVSLHVYMKYEAGRSGLPVWAAPGTRQVLEPFTGQGFGDTFDWADVDDGDGVAISDVMLRFSRTQHPVPTVAVEATAPNGTRLIYTSDTGPGWSVAAFAPGAHLVISEATYNSEATGPPHHLTATQAGDAARAAGARRLLITHLWPTLDPDVSVAEASAAFGEHVELAEPGATVTL